MDKTAFYDLSYGVYLCTSWDEGKPVGCVANSAMQITSQPATIAVSLNKNNYTHKAVSRAHRPRRGRRSRPHRYLRLPHVQGVR